MPIKVKICGLNSPEAIEAVARAEADYAGFVCYPPSPRHISPCELPALTALLPAAIEKVVVLVNPDDALLDEIFAVFRPDFLQLHGGESPQRIAEIKSRYGVKIIRALRIAREGDLNIVLGDEDMLLFDSAPKSAALPGGTGKSFDWCWLQGKKFLRPWFLSGGISAANVLEAVKISGAQMVDGGVYIDVRHLDPAILASRVPSFLKAAMAQEGKDASVELVPIKPVAHYTMGGIATNERCETAIKGLYAAGECAANGCHGANRLGGNSLLEAAVFGRIAGEEAANYAIKQGEFLKIDLSYL